MFVSAKSTVKVSVCGY